MLQGLRVLEATQFLAGPLAGVYLAAMGAEVIKIEKPEHGDDARRIGPFEERSGESAYFMSVNRGKKSVALDLKDAYFSVRVKEEYQKYLKFLFPI